MGIIILSIAAMILFFIMQSFSPTYKNIPLFIALIFGGIPLIYQIISKAIQKDWGADLLAAIALIAAVILHEYLAGVFIILMLSSGQALESYAMRKASSVLLALSNRMPSIAHRKAAATIEDIALSDIQVGDSIAIYPHEVCTVDGVVIEGRSSMDESYLTGEPYQISKVPGSPVLSGAINGDSLIIIRAEKLPSDSRYAAIVSVLTDAEQKRPKIRRLADRIGAGFALFALIFACIAWFITGDAIRFLSIIVIATPCPLLIAIPITIISAISMAARQSIIIKDPVVLEQLPACRTAIFDKTGTLTYGKPFLTDMVVEPPNDQKNILQYVASIERYSKHPLSTAILEEAKKENLPLLDALEISEKPGEGLTGIIENHVIQITSRKKLISHYPEFSAKLPEHEPGLECIVLVDKKYAGTFRFRDMPRTDSKSFIKHLKPSHQFNKIMLVSGDRESEVNYLGNLLNITEIYSSQTPEEKLALVRNEVKNAPTLFMGDGINDAPALTAATVGVAFGSYSNITSEAAGAVILENTLQKVDTLIHLSYETRTIALQSAMGGMLLSVIGMFFAAAGLIPPVMGAILQELIDVFAILNALRLTLKSHIEVDLNEKNGNS